MFVLRVLTEALAFNPRLGPLRHVFLFGLAYVLFALCLVYVVAPIRAVTGAYTIADKLKYDAERWLATAIYDRRGSFVGTFDPRLDSARDVNYTDHTIEVGDYTANPDHKSIPVREVPEFYWKCLLFHEDRYLGDLAQPLRHRSPRRPEDPDLLDPAHDCIEATEYRRRRLDAADAVRARHLQDPAGRQRRRPDQAEAARSANGGSPPSSIAC